MRQRSESGFTLIELMIVVAIIAIIAAVAVPNQLASRMSANEAAAISTLRNLVSAQAQFQAAAAIDSDSDGVGTYGGLGEMAGSVPLSARAPLNGGGVLDPPILSPHFSNVDALGRVTRSGYVYQIFLPDAAQVGQPEGPGGAPNPNWDEDGSEFLWSAYAWPAHQGSSGTRTFFVNHRGEIIQTRMAATVYSGVNAPSAHAALNGADMTSPLAIRGAVANDGNSWTKGH